MSIEKYSSTSEPQFARDLSVPKLAGFLWCLFAAILLTGCAHRYDMTLTNGGRITNVTKPVFDRDQGAFFYKDVTGKVHHVSSGRVLEIKPHSRKNTTPGSVQQ